MMEHTDFPSSHGPADTASDAERHMACLEVELARRTLHLQEEILRLAAGQMGFDYFTYDFTTGTAQVFGPQNLLPRTLFNVQGLCPDFCERLTGENLVSPEYADVFREAFQTARQGTERVVRELILRGEGPGPLWGRLSLTLMRHGPHSGRMAVGTLENITRQKEAARNYLNETQFFQALLAEKDAYGQVDVTEDRIMRIGGMWNLYNEIKDKVSYTQLFTEFIHKVVHPEDRAHYLEIMSCENFEASLNNGVDRLGCEFRRIVDQNKLMWMQLSVNLFRDPLTRHVLALLSITNINEKKKQELSLLRDSRLDRLTNALNKMAGEMQIREYLDQAAEDEQYALVVLDVDDFKQVNDSHGHRAGDHVLSRLAGILGRTFRKNDIISRFGGDEFVILLKHMDGAPRVAERMEALYEKLLDTDGGEPIFCSAGVALGQGGMPYEQLFHNADLALYEAKSMGKRRFRFYSDGSDALAGQNAPDSSSAPESSPAFVAPAAVPGSMRPGPFPLFRPQPRTDNGPSFDQFIGDQGDIAYLIDPDTFDLICGNKAFYDRIGMNEAQCAGMKCHEAMHRRDTPCPFCSKANWSTDKFYLWRNFNEALEQEFLIKNKLVSWRGHEAVLALAVDISNDKSIVDSMECGATEVNNILSGVQRMTEAPSLAEAMTSALETIVCFFRAERARLWQPGPDENYSCVYSWSRRDGDAANNGRREVSAWIDSQKWEQPLMVESPEAMLCYSYDMYHYMKSRGITNQRWIAVKENDEVCGFISVDNISSNFQNVAFLESFSVFIASELKKRSLVEEALYADRHDDLTDLLSRKSFEEYLRAFHPDQIACLGVLTANFNNLKGVNSACGFQTGNYFIRQFADMLREVFPAQLKFRLNGDEFLVIAPEITRTGLDDAIKELERLLAENGGFTVALGSSWDDVENDLAVLMEQASQGMQTSKKRHYDSGVIASGGERRRMLSDLITALEQREYEVFLQPKVELTHGTVIGAEALIRHRHKELGLVLPAQFIDMLEKNNLIRYIDLFTFEEVCRQLEKWKQRGLFVPVISINFSRLTLLERDILASMEAIISRYDVSKKSIEIEITEGIVNMGKSMLHQAANDLYKAGYTISLDDFGTKYANLSILSELDFSMLKVDKSLIGKLGSRDSDKLIMKNIIYMCKDLGISVLAEGIETKQQENILQDMECQMGQGYLYGRPVPFDEFTRTYIEVIRQD